MGEKVKWHDRFIPRLILNAISDVWNSFKDGKDGLGARRLTTFVHVVMVVYLHKYHIKGNELYFYIGDCLMIIVLIMFFKPDDIIRLINSIKNNEKTDTTPTDTNTN